MFALAFFSFRLWVKVRLSFCVGAVGLNFWASCIIMASATLAHLWGSLQPFDRSSSQFGHSQLFHGACLGSLLRVRLQSFSRFFTFVILCVFLRQLSLDLWYVRGGAPMWNQAGNCRFSCWESFRGAKVRFAFLAVLTRLRMQGGRVLARWPLVGGDQVVRE